MAGNGQTKQLIEVGGEELDETMAVCIITIAQLDGGTETAIQERCSILRDLNKDLWAILQAKAEGEAFLNRSWIDPGSILDRS